MLRKLYTSIFLIFNLAIFAQTHPAAREGHIIASINGIQDSVAVYNSLLNNAPAEFSSHVPKFAVMGKNKTFYLGIGGIIKTTLSVDFGNVVENPNEFFTSQIPVYKEPGNGGKIAFSAQQSCLFLNFVALPDSENEIGAFIDFNLLGHNYLPQLQYAYARYRGLKVGFDKTLFSDPSSTPPSIDYEGVNSSTDIGNALINYNFKFGKKKQFGAGIGIEMPKASFTESLATEYVNQRVPDIPAYFSWTWDDNSSHIRFSAIVRNLLYRNLLSEKNVNKTGWGVSINGTATIIPQIIAYWQATYGEGIASYIQDMTDTGMDLLPSSKNPAVLSLSKTWGAYVGLQYNFSQNIFASASYSHVRNYSNKTFSPDFDDQYKYAQYINANLFWNINSLLQAGVEYIYGRRMDWNNLQAHDNRILLGLSLSF